jgi:L,D-peptidoglycan transpeptidase YkuD (ErfK/YbiS/YcfS/YnhG family)
MLRAALCLSLLAATALLTARLVISTRSGSPAREATSSSKSDSAAVASPHAKASRPRRSDQMIAGVGRVMADHLPRDAREVVLVSGATRDGSKSVVSLWEKRTDGWNLVVGGMPGHNGLEGWTAKHKEGDEKTPIGIFSLTEAGGELPNPGTQLPYQHAPAFYSRSIYLGNEPTRVFDYVVAINFNRLADAPPSSSVEPLGAAAGSGIWLHVDDGQPTAGCVGISRANMVRVLRWLEPAQHPVIVMGDKASLAA